MKNLKYIRCYRLIMVVLLAGLSSCKDYLTIDELDNRTVEQGYYDSAAKVEQSVIGIYVDLRRALLADHAWLMYGEARVGDLTVQNPVQMDVLAQRLKASELQKLADWGYFYDVIYDANQTLQMLDALDKNVLNSFQYKLYKGESLALKSLAYFYVARIWGDVPSAEKQDFGAKLTQQEAIARAITWSKEAQQLLPWNHLNDDGIVSKAMTEVRFSKTAVSLLLAQQQLWLDQSSEVATMLATTFTGVPADSLSVFGLSMGIDRRQDIPQTPLAASQVSLTVDKLNSIYPAGDTRRSQYAISGTTASLIVSNQELLTLYDTREIELLLAESKWRSQNAAAAIPHLKIAAAGATENYDLLTDASFGAALLKERQRLLMGQGQRFFDLVRFGKVSDVLPGLTAQQIKDGAIYWPLSDRSMAGTSWKQITYWAQ